MTHVEAISGGGTSRDHICAGERDESGGGEGELGEHFEEGIEGASWLKRGKERV